MGYLQKWVLESINYLFCLIIQLHKENIILKGYLVGLWSIILVVKFSSFVCPLPDPTTTVNSLLSCEVNACMGSLCLNCIHILGLYCCLILHITNMNTRPILWISFWPPSIYPYVDILLVSYIILLPHRGWGAIHMLHYLQDKIQYIPP